MNTINNDGKPVTLGQAACCAQINKIKLAPIKTIVIIVQNTQKEVSI